MSNGNDLTRESRINTLKEAQEARKQDANFRVYQAIERLQKLHAKINFHTVAREAKVSVSYLYKYPELKQHIAELRSQQNSLPVKSVAKPNSTSHGKVVTRLQEKIKKLEAENQELKRKSEALAGQVYRVHHLQAQVERLQQENQDLRAKLGEREIAKKVTLIDEKRKSKSPITDSIHSELETLGIKLNSTLTKTIKSATEQTVLDAIEALKDQLTKKDIPNAGGWLNTAIKEGWTKPESISTRPSSPQSQFVTSTNRPTPELISPDKLKQLSNLFAQDND